MTGVTGASGATGMGASETGSASGMGADFAAALAIEKRNQNLKDKSLVNERALQKKNKKFAVLDDEMLGIPKRRIKIL